MSAGALPILQVALPLIAAPLCVLLRRSGLACTAGTCYEVLGFEGIEMRLLNRFF